MLDDDIVFLGTNSGPSSHQTPSPPQRPVTGIALHIEKQGPIEGYGMLFRKASTSVVHIGRRSGFEALDSGRSQDHEQLGNAMFRCAVVSRRHAKIAFSDSGHAYLIDLGSHHGTHIRKPADKFSKMIKPETPTQLADGDVVTFGKTVGKGDECVRPIVARIELLHAGQNTAAFKPLVVPSTSSPSFSVKSVPKSASGRYGVTSSPSSSSDESYSSHSGIYSDIEEIPPPTTSTSKAPTALSQSQSQNSSLNESGSLGHAFNILKRFLPPGPSHAPATPKRLPSVTEIVDLPVPQMSLFFGPESVPTSPGYALAPMLLLERQVSPTFAPLDFSRPVGFDASEHDIYEHDSVDAEGDEDGGESIENDNDNDNDDDDDDDDSNRSRSNSPMDLASPSPAPEVVVSRSLSIPPPSAFIISPTPSLRASLQPAIPPAVSQSDSGSGDMDIPLVNSPEGSFSSGSSSGINSPLTDFLREAVGGARSSAVPWDIRPESVSPVVGSVEPPAPAITRRSFSPLPAIPPLVVPPLVRVPSVSVADFKSIQDTVESLKADVAKLQSHRRKYKARFNSNVHVISEKLSEFDDRLLEVNAEYIVLSNQVDNVMHVEVPDLNAHIEMVQEKVDEFIEERMELDHEREREREEEEEMDVGEKYLALAALGDAVQEMKEFRENTKKQIDEELAAIKHLRETAMARFTQLQEVVQAQAIASAAHVCASPTSKVRITSRDHAEPYFTADPSHSPQTPVLTSLKRKRDDTDENEDEDAVEEQERCESESESEYMSDESSSSSSSSSSSDESDSESSIFGRDDDKMVTDSAAGSGTVVGPKLGAPGLALSVYAPVPLPVPVELGLVEDQVDEMVAAATTARAPDAPPPRKRARRFASVIAQTATAVTIGAVVTWSALAFS